MSVACGRCEGKVFVVVGAPLCVVLRIKDSDRRAFEQDAALGAVTALRVLFAGVVQQLLGGKSREPSLPVLIWSLTDSQIRENASSVLNGQLISNIYCPIMPEVFP